MTDLTSRVGATALGVLESEVIREDIFAAISETIAQLNTAWVLHSNESEKLRIKEKALLGLAEAYGSWAEAFVDQHKTPTQVLASPESYRDLYEDALVFDSGSWSLEPSVKNRLESLQSNARSELITGSSKVFTVGRHKRNAVQFAGEAVAASLIFRSEAERADAQRQALEAELVDRTAALVAEFDEKFAQAEPHLLDAIGKLHPGAAPWDSVKWLDWAPLESHESVLAGVYKIAGGQIKNPEVRLLPEYEWPVFTSLRRGLLARHDGSQRETAHNFAQALMLRGIASSRPGDIRLTIFDPTGLGQSADSLLELAEFDRELIGGKVWSSTEDLKRVLADLSAHMELVIQKYLRTEFETISEFNEAAGEVAEPYRLLVVFDYPARFDEDCLHELRRIIENGPRCGIGTILLHNIDVEGPGLSDQLDLDGQWLDLRVPVKSTGETPFVLLDFVPDSDELANKDLVSRIIKAVGDGVRTAQSSAVSFEKMISLFASGRDFDEIPAAGAKSAEVAPSISDPSTWWTKSARSSISVPVGQRGARDIAMLSIDSRAHTGALLVGRPGSGKSTLLHSVICAAAMMYGPDELELHLIDFKEGVEFKMYAAERLPHARSVAVESDREFGLSVLQYMQSEIERRGALMRESAGTNASLETLREESGERLPRILLVFDEFQVLFEKNDKLGGAAASLLEGIVRQGRGFGIHVLLGSQSLSGLEALGQHVLQLLPVRILLPATESDTFKVLGEGNTEGTQLTESGDGILNADAGSVAANQRFRGALFEEGDRRDFLRQARELADSNGFVRGPVVFEGSEPIPATSMNPEVLIDELRGAGPRQLRLRLGAPMSMAGTADIELRREQGANLLAIARDSGGDTNLSLGSVFSLPRAVFAHAVLDAAGQGADVRVIDFTSIDDGVEELLSPLTESKLISLNRRRQVPKLLEELAIEVSRRVDEDDTRAPTILLAIFGMHRARDFDENSIDFDDAEALKENLLKIVTDGPEFGVHLLFTFDTLASVSKRLPSSIVRECSWRVAGQMSGDDSLDLVGVDDAANLRTHQFLAANEDRGILKRCTAIDLPVGDWWAEYLKHAMTDRIAE